MVHVLCEISKGLRDSERVVAVRDARGRLEYLRVEFDFLTQDSGKYWLPAGMIHEDREHGVMLIELPQESESGANRIWVPSSNLLQRSLASA